MTAKKGDFFITGNCVGQVVEVYTDGNSVLVEWTYKPDRTTPLTIQRLEMLDKVEVIPRDVAYNLAEVLKRNELR